MTWDACGACVVGHGRAEAPRLSCFACQAHREASGTTAAHPQVPAFDPPAVPTAFGVMSTSGRPATGRGRRCRRRPSPGTCHHSGASRPSSGGRRRTTASTRHRGRPTRRLRPPRSDAHPPPGTPRRAPAPDRRRAPRRDRRRRARGRTRARARACARKDAAEKRPRAAPAGASAPRRSWRRPPWGGGHSRRIWGFLFRWTRAARTAVEPLENHPGRRQPRPDRPPRERTRSARPRRSPRCARPEPPATPRYPASETAIPRGDIAVSVAS